MKKIKEILFRPKEFFKNVKKEKGIKKAFVYLLILSLFYYVLSLTNYFLFSEEQKALITGVFDVSPFALYIISDVLFYFFGLIMSFVTSYFFYLWLKLFECKEPWNVVYKLTVYSNTPLYLIGWIPFIGAIVGWVYSLILMIIGIREVYNVSTKKAALIYLIPIAILIFLLFVFLFVIFFIYYSSLGLESTAGTF